MFKNFLKSTERITKSTLIISLLIILGTIVAYILNGYFNIFRINDLNTEKLGHFGDFIGGFVGVVLTFLATIIIYTTYKSQKKELVLNRTLFSNQNFENTFFNMLKVHQDIKSEISINNFDFFTKDQTEYTDFKKGVRYNRVGRAFFKKIQLDFTRLVHHYPHTELKFDNIEDINNRHSEEKIDVLFIKDLKTNPTLEKHKKLIKFKYDIFFNYYQDYLGDYLRNVYHILKFISKKKEEEIKNNDEKSASTITDKYKFYSDIFQSQMCYSELFLIFYNSFKFKKVRNYIKEFDFIENLYSRNLLDEFHINFKHLGKIKTD